MKPILFNTDMVRAILAGRKTATRRVVKFKPGQNPHWTGYTPDGPVLYGSNNIPAVKAPYRPGDILYVRETWYKDAGRYMYRADYSEKETFYQDGKEVTIKWHPSIHMPRDAARIFLRVTEVRAERLRNTFSKPVSPIFALQREGIDIGERCRECIESCGAPCCVCADDGECGMLNEVRGVFSDLWDSTIKPADRDKHGWSANPWVWTIAFERISREEAENG